MRFKQQDIATGLLERYEVITAFAVVHDADDPAAVPRTAASTGPFSCSPCQPPPPPSTALARSAAAPILLASPAGSATSSTSAA